MCVATLRYSARGLWDAVFFDCRTSFAPGHGQGEAFSPGIFACDFSESRLLIVSDESSCAQIMIL